MAHTGADGMRVWYVDATANGWGDTIDTDIVGVFSTEALANAWIKDPMNMRSYWTYDVYDTVVDQPEPYRVP